MIVGVDIGNTKIKAAAFSHDKIGAIHQFDGLHQVCAHWPAHDLWICSVGMRQPEVARVTDRFHWLSANTALPLQLNYDTPESLGADRIALAVGARTLMHNPTVLVIDIGTCVTYDLIHYEQYLGGAITPGVDMRLAGMHTGTRGLPDLRPLDMNSKIELPGKSTKSCMQSGVVAGLQYEMQGFITNFNKQYGPLEVLLTGGLASYFESKIKAYTFASSKIVLTGLHGIWRFNEGL